MLHLALGLGLGLAQPAGADEAVLVGTLALPRSPDLHGLSGLELSEDGNCFIAIADRGWFVTGRIVRQDGRPVDLQADPPAIRMIGMHGGPMRSHESDAEGLVLAPDGRVFVSFEIYHRVRAWRDITAAATWMPDLPEVPLFDGNAGIEALALGPDGALYALPEDVVEPGGIPVWRYPVPLTRMGPDGRQVDRYVDAVWTRAFLLPARGPFRPVGADFGPDGGLYVLERAVVPPLGFRSRIRRFAVGPGGPTDETLLLETAVGTHGNLEGLSVWRDSDGAIRLTMVTDDNGLALQRNEIVEYRVVSAPGDG